MTAEAPSPFDARRPYRLHPQVALRPEPFGALAYHYGNRRLVFLRDPELVRVVEGLDGQESAESTLDALGVPAARRTAFGRALASLHRAEVIAEVSDGR